MSRLRNYNHVVNSIFDIYASVTYLSLSPDIQEGKSALLLASENGHLEVVKCLVANGANIGDKNRVRYISFIPPRVLITRSTIYMTLHFNDYYGIH